MIAHFADGTSRDVPGDAVFDATQTIIVARPQGSLEAAARAARDSGSLDPPKHILNAPTSLMKELGYGDGYEYDHNAEDGFSGQNYFPDGMERQKFYRPVQRGFERDITKRLEYWDKLRRDKEKP